MYTFERWSQIFLNKIPDLLATSIIIILFFLEKRKGLEWLGMEWWCRVNYINDGANDFENVLVVWVVDEWNDIVCEVIKEMFCSFANPLTN